MLINALSSGATGILIAVFSGYTAQLFGVSQRIPFVAVGMFLIAFALLVYVHSRSNAVSKGWLKLIVILDTLWVIESLILVFSQLFKLSTIGYALIIAVAVWVALMALLQARGLRLMSTTALSKT